jgi:hypothetical protein
MSLDSLPSRQKRISSVMRVLGRALAFPRKKPEVDHANQERTPRSQLISRSQTSEGFPSETHVQRGTRVVGGNKQSFVE